MAGFEALESLRRALDHSYQRLRERARCEWDRNFADGFDPSDACVTARVIGDASKKQTVPGSGFLAVRTRSAKIARKFSLPHFAH